MLITRYLRNTLDRLRRAVSGHTKTNEPYSPPHHHSFPTEAYAFGRKPGTPLEGWEIITLLTITASVAVCIFGGFTNTGDGFKTWARKEYLAREKVIEKGVEIEFGKYYNTTKYSEEEIDTMPIKEEN